MATPEAQLPVAAQPTSAARPRSALHDPESAALWRQQLHVEIGPAGRVAVLRVAGDIDMLTLPLMCAALVTALETRPAELVVDVSMVRFCGVRGFALLAAMARTTATNEIGYAVTGVGSHLDRAATQIWSDQPPARYPSIKAACTAIRRRRQNG